MFYGVAFDGCCGNATTSLDINSKPVALAPNSFLNAVRSTGFSFKALKLV